MILVAAGALIVFADLFIFVGVSAVRCDDPEEFRCSGHLIYGLPNTILGLAVLGLGFLLIAVDRIRRYRLMR